MDRFRVTAQGLNIRREPSLQGAVVSVLTRGMVVERLGMSTDQYWYNIKTAKGVVGWSSHKYLAALAQEDQIAPTDFPWLVTALREIGQHEQPGAHHNPRILSYLQSTTLPAPFDTVDETHWCSAFVNWCMERAGFAGTDSAAARSWLTWGQAIETPRRGCVAVFKRDGGGHVGFYMGETANAIKVLGGNQRDAVNIAPQPRANLLGYRLPL